MWLTAIEVDRLRNLKALRLALPAGMTLLTGRNGQGKTSVLEAIYLLGTGRSFRTPRIDELVARSGGPLRVAGSIRGRHGDHALKAILDSGVRRLLADGREVEIEDFLGRLDLVALTAERMQVVRGGPDERRRFLDRGVVGLESSFLRTLGRYRRVLQQRNALLRSRSRGPGPGIDGSLDAWDERLVDAALEVHSGRRRYALPLAARMGQGSRALFPDSEGVTIRYEPSPAEAGEAEIGCFREAYAKALVASRGRDRMLGYTGCGPHRDDLILELDGMDLRRFGSAGQARSAMIALKLGKLSLLRERRGESPVFLMDDFDSDLDEVRARALAAYLHEGGFQALVATSKVGMAERLEVSFAKAVIDDGVARLA